MTLRNPFIDRTVSATDDVRRLQLGDDILFSSRDTKPKARDEERTNIDDPLDRDLEKTLTRTTRRDVLVRLEAGRHNGVKLLQVTVDLAQLGEDALTIQP